MRPGLAPIQALLDAVGNPESRMRLVQIGGTNGKGSASAMLAAMLHSAGLRTGLYTSPHLRSVRERIRVDGRCIAEDDLADGVDALGTLFARLDATVCEGTTARACDRSARASRAATPAQAIALAAALCVTTALAAAATASRIAAARA